MFYVTKLFLVVKKNSQSSFVNFLFTESFEIFDSGILTITTSYEYDGRNKYKYDASYVKISGIEVIGSNAFYLWSSLVSAEIGDSVTLIGQYVFASCYSLERVTIGNNVKVIGNYIYYTIIIGMNVNTIGIGVFQSCKSLITIAIPNLVTFIPYSMLYNCRNLKSITIDNMAFQYCLVLTNFIIPSSVTSIGSSHFLDVKVFNA